MSHQCTVEVAILHEDGSYFTEYVTLAADPADPQAVNRAKDSWARSESRGWSREDKPKWSVIVTDHDTLAEIMEGLEGWQPPLWERPKA